MDARDGDVPESETPLQRLVDEGMMIAESVLRMQVKNRIIVQVLGAAADTPAGLDGGEVGNMVIEALESFIAERRASANYLAIARDIASHREGEPTDVNDYRDRDAHPLDRRHRIEAALVQELERRRDSAEFLARVQRRAQRAAMDEMFRPRMLPAAPRARFPLTEAEHAQALDDLGAELRRLADSRSRERGAGAGE